MRAIGRLLPLAIAKHVLAGRIDVDPLEITKIDRVGAGGPGAAEEIRVGHLQPEAAPAARGVTVQQPGAWVGHQGKGLLQVGNEFLDEGPAPRPVGGAVGKDMVARAAIRVEDDPDQVPGILHSRVRHEHPRHVMIAAEAGDDVNRGKLPGGLLFGQDHRRAMLDRPMIEGREQRALQLGELDPLGLLELPRGDELVNFEVDRARCLGIDPGVDDRAIGVALARANVVGIGVDSNDGLNRVVSGLE